MPADLTIVVSNDNGGGIFELLEQGDPRFSDVSSRMFGTPHDVDVGALCRAYHVDSRQIEVDELGAALDEPAAGHAGAGGQGRPIVAAAAARRHQGRAVTRLASALAVLKAWARILIHGRSGEFPEHPRTPRRALGAHRRR